MIILKSFIHLYAENKKIMKIKILFFISILFVSIQLNSASPTKGKNKIVLPYLEIKDDVIKFAATDVYQMILRKNRGFLWPATKITLSKTGDKLFFDIVAIDNSWCNMLTRDETPYGFFVIGGRMFVVASKDRNFDFDSYFIRDNEIEKTFNRPDETENTTVKNPIWQYLHKGTMATVLNSLNIRNLGR